MCAARAHARRGARARSLRGFSRGLSRGFSRGLFRSLFRGLGAGLAHLDPRRAAAALARGAAAAVLAVAAAELAWRDEVARARCAAPAARVAEPHPLDRHVERRPRVELLKRELRLNLQRCRVCRVRIGSPDHDE